MPTGAAAATVMKLTAEHALLETWLMAGLAPTRAVPRAMPRQRIAQRLTPDNPAAEQPTLKRLTGDNLMAAQPTLKHPTAAENLTAERRTAVAAENITSS
jgi:hypothetical protein